MVEKATFSWESFHKMPIVGILRGMPGDTILKIAEVYAAAGFSTLEVTMNTAGATEIIADLRKAFPTLNIGAGTVCNMHELEQAVEAGAQFIVTPILDEMVVKTTVGMGVPVFPGAYSPTEIYKAWSLGASAVKVFPASQLGVKYIKDISAPLNQIKLLPTGGVSRSNIKSFFEAGVFGVGMGSSLFDKTSIQALDFKGLKNHFLSLKSEISAFLK